MKRIFTISILLALFSSFSFGAGLSFNGIAAQAGLVLPQEDFMSTGFALGAKVNMGEIADNFGLFPILQYHLPGDDLGSGSGDVSIGILVIGADVHYAINDQFYAGGGINYNSITFEYEIDTFFGTQTYDAGGSEIGFSALAGYNLNLGGMPAAIEGRYNIVSDYNSLLFTLNVFFGTN